MSRTIQSRPFYVECKCDRCRDSDARESTGDVRPPAGWKFVNISDDEQPSSHSGGRAVLLCEACVAVLLSVIGTHPVPQ